MTDSNPNPRKLARIPERCREIMRSPVRTLAEHETVLAAARMMREHDIGLVVVCDASGCLSGVLTDRDIVIRVVASNLDPFLTIGRIMTRGAVTCAPDDALAEVMRAMREHRHSRVIVAEEGRQPVGVISLSDLAQYETVATVGRTLRAVSERKYGPERP